MKELLATALASLKSAFQELTQGQKITLSVLLVMLSVMFLSIWALSGSTEYQILRAGGPQEILPLVQRLDAKRIPSKISPLADGQVQIEFSGADYQRALEVVSDTSMNTPKSPSLLDAFVGRYPSGTMQQVTIDEAKRERVEEMILFSRKIARVRVLVTRGERPIFPSEKRKDTAAVKLELRPRFSRLSRNEAQAVRDLVALGLNIPAEYIHIGDDRGSVYNSESDIPELVPEQEKERQRIIREVERLYRGQYKPTEFSLAVMVHVKNSGSEGVAIDADAEQTPKTNRRTGGIEEVHVNLILDREAVGRKIKSSSKDLDVAVTEYVGEQEKKLAKLLTSPNYRTQVSVSAEVFIPNIPGAIGTTGTGGREARKISVWHLVVYATAGVFALAFVFLGALGRRKNRLAIAASEGSAPIDGRESLETPDLPKRGLSACQATLKLAQEAGGVVRERPEVAAAILRLWLAANTTDAARQPANVLPGDAPTNGKEEREVTLSSS